ncbi:hypothetical protein [Streptomyces noursei]|uniref:hypothetical protein n=1 Tax=Streptomyces noursei TaxID=1971 RepID=UPI000A79B503|nr:hypothetical protein [Streptomyces noursei]
MAFRRTIPFDELREKHAGRNDSEHTTTYQASRGGWHRPTDKPVPGTPKDRKGGA